MNAFRGPRLWAALAVGLLVNSTCFGEVVINEYLVDQRLPDTGFVHPSTREFVELYNSGASPVNIGGWQLKSIELGARFTNAFGTTTYTIPANTMLAPNDYFVIGRTGGTGVDFDPAPALKTNTGVVIGDLFPDGQNGSNRNFVFELRDSGSLLVDAVASEVTFGSERANLTAAQIAFTGGGIWPDVLCTDVPTGAPTFNSPANPARYRDGARSGANGRDFGFLPATPGATNNLPYADSTPGGTADGIYIVPNVESLVTETPLGSPYGMYGSFVQAVVAEPHVLDGIVVQKATATPPPVGTKAIVNYDPAGGGNVVQVKNLVNSFDIYTYIDTDQYNLMGTPGHETDTLFAEWTTYGIGTTAPLFASFDVNGLQGSSFTRSGNTGVGWAIEKIERDYAGTIETRTVLQLINFGQGGDSVADPLDPFPTWDLIQEFDMTDDPSGWHRLAITYNPDTNMVEARYDNQTFNFAYSTGLDGDFNSDGMVDAADYVVYRKLGGSLTEADFNENFGESGGAAPKLVGTFYVGYRDGLDDAVGDDRHFEKSRPATWLQYQEPAAGGGGSVPEPSAIALLAVAMAGMAASGRRRA